MKKIFSLLFILTIGILVFTGCTSKNVSGSLEELMKKVYSKLPNDERPMMLENIVVTEENMEYFLGTKDLEIEEALASESGIGSIAHSVVLVRVKDGANVNDVMTKIKENVNPRKWICVGVEDDEVIIKNKGNLVIVIIAQSGREKLEEGFNSL